MCQGFEEFSFESPEFRHTLLINHYFYILSNTHINVFSMTARSDTVAVYARHKSECPNKGNPY
jgi:hypothetical protein